jgi:hypothetical protein
MLEVVRKMPMSRKFTCAILLLAGVASPAYAISKEVEAAIRALDSIEANSSQLEPMCAILKEMAALGPADDTKAEELDVQMETYLGTLGPEQLKAWQLNEDLEVGSDDAQALNAAFGRIETKCLD